MKDKTIRPTFPAEAQRAHTEYIEIRGARSNNLKDISVQIPKNSYVVVTGLSGSGKSSLVMDTLYAEGQRRYVESLSSYARQFLQRMKKPDVDVIHGLCPAIAIEQRTVSSNARSTVGSLTEIYDYLRILFARIGTMYSPITGKPVQKHSVQHVVKYLTQSEKTGTWYLLMPIPEKYRGQQSVETWQNLLQSGYRRLFNGTEVVRIDNLIQSPNVATPVKGEQLWVLVDRIRINGPVDDAIRRRIRDSASTAFRESQGYCTLWHAETGEKIEFSSFWEADGVKLPELTPQLFNYNSPIGACPKCEGYGRILGIDPKKVIPNPRLSVYEGAVQCWKGEKSSRWWKRFIQQAHLFDFPVHTPYAELSEEHKHILWHGNAYVPGIYDYFRQVERETYKIQNRIILARFRGKTQCPECGGARLRKEALLVRIGDKHIGQLVQMPLFQLLDFFNTLKLNPTQAAIAKALLRAITVRLETLCQLGLGYLHLDRLASTLSGGETQRIHLTRILGANLTEALYILDEPSIGLHPRDTDNLLKVLLQLRDLGNTVLIVEHDETLIRNADYLIDMGPGAGIHGGQIVYQGPPNALLQNAPQSLTAQYLTRQKQIPLPKVRRPKVNAITLHKVRKHNLQHIDVTIPLHSLVVVTGVSGSGKSTLIKDVLYHALRDTLAGNPLTHPEDLDDISGDLKLLRQVELIGQRPLGRSQRSNPATYTKAYDHIRKLFAAQKSAKLKGLQAKHFSFNTEGGRCEECQGEGEITVDMQFMADVRLVCEACGGKRFKREILDVRYRDKNIYDILQMNISEAVDFFHQHPEITKRLQPLVDLDLGYLLMGQSTSTLSGGEAQRLKIASYLVETAKHPPTMFLFDEPTTGLHFDNIRTLLRAFNALIEQGHSVVVIEHHPDVIKCADWIIDLGPEGGPKGGQLIFSGTPEELIHCPSSITGSYLKPYLSPV